MITKISFHFDLVTSDIHYDLVTYGKHYDLVTCDNVGYRGTYLALV